MKTRWLPAVMALALVLCLAAAAFAQLTPRIAKPPTPVLAVAKTPGLYEIQAVGFSENDATKMIGDVGVIARQEQTAAALVPGGGLVIFGRSEKEPTAIYNSAHGSLVWFADLAQGGGAPPAGQAKLLASEWVKRNELALAEEGGAWEVEDVTTLTQLNSGDNAEPQKVIQTVRFVRKLEGMKVRGEHSILSVQVGAEGKVVGATRDFRAVKRSGRVLQMKSKEALNAAMKGKLNDLLKRLRQANPDYKAELLNTEMIYYEQGLRYLQPALFGNVRITGPEGLIGHQALLIPALLQTPEPIQDRTRAAQQMPRETKPGPGEQGRALPDRYQLELTGLAIHRTPVAMVAYQPDIRYGMYVVRDDSSAWVDDAWDFHTNLSAANNVYRMLINPAAKQTIKDQYYWNHVWLFRDGEGQPDYSKQFVRKVDFVIIEGHGAPYLISTRSNCCDIIRLNGIPGYGPHSELGGRTDYVLWKSCHVIPAPPEDSNWASTWWTMFKGMRGNYGFCTSMWIDDDISDNFGFSLGLGVPALSAWFSAANSCKWGHGSGHDMEYGSAVMPCGQENQRIYDYGALPNPGCLTIWWQHP